jgi:hypothetical protein
VVELKPHLLADASFLHMAGTDKAFGQALLGSLTRADASKVWTRLVDAASLLPAAAQWAAVLIGRDSQKLQTAVEIILTAAPTHRTLDRELAGQVKDAGLSEGQTIALQESIPQGFLPTTAAALAELRVQQLRAKAAEDVEEYEPELAAALNNQASLLWEAGGRTAEALKTVGEAVTLYRRLAAGNPALYEPDLARAVRTAAGMMRSSVAASFPVVGRFPLLVPLGLADQVPDAVVNVEF